MARLRIPPPSTPLDGGVFVSEPVVELSRDEQVGKVQRALGRQMAANHGAGIVRYYVVGLFFLTCGALIWLLLAGLREDGLAWVVSRRGLGLLLGLALALLCGLYAVHRHRRLAAAVAGLAAELGGTWSANRPEDTFGWLDRHWRSRLPHEMVFPRHAFDHRWSVQATWQGHPVLVFWMRIDETNVSVDKTVVFVARNTESAGGDEARLAVEEDHFTLTRFPSGVRGECDGIGVRALRWDRIRRVLDRSIAMIEGDRSA